MSDIKIGDLMAVVTTGLHKMKAGEYIFGHVTRIEINLISNQLNFYVMWDNGNQFWYNRGEMQEYKKVVDIARNS